MLWVLQASCMKINNATNDASGNTFTPTHVSQFKLESVFLLTLQMQNDCIKQVSEEFLWAEMDQVP